MNDATAPFELTATRHFAEWLYETGHSLAFTTHQAGKLFLLGARADGRLSVFERTFDRCMGLAVDPAGETVWLAARAQIWRLCDVLGGGETPEGYDRLYAPRTSHVTGDLDVHDMGIDRQGRLVFVNTLFSCISALNERDSFAPLWSPPFISALAPEDRCHLNGVAIEEGVVRYATALAESDAADGWRGHRLSGGCAIDIGAHEIVARGLSMPHSPRLYEGRLWLLNSGSGELGWIDPGRGRFEPVAFCRGYARGLAFAGRYAVVGLSKQRASSLGEGLAYEDRLREKNVQARCGLVVIDLETGEIAHGLRIDGVVEELYDVAILPGARRPAMIGLKGEGILRTISVGAAAAL